MKKQFKVVLLYTSKASKLFIYNSATVHNQLCIGEEFIRDEKREFETENQLLIITSDEEIKEDDWFYSEPHNKIFKCTREDDLEHYDGELLKVIASSDKKLTPKCWIPESFLNAYAKSYNSSNLITEVGLQYVLRRKSDDCEFILQSNGLYQASDEHGTETLSVKDGYFEIKTRVDGSVIVHKNKTYSEEEVKAIAQEAWIESFFTKRNTDITGFKEWFEKQLNN